MYGCASCSGNGRWCAAAHHRVGVCGRDYTLSSELLSVSFSFLFHKKKQLGADQAGSQPTTTSIVTLTQMIII